MKQGRDRFEPISNDIKELVVMYRTEHNLSYRDIEKRLDVSRETARLICLDRIPEEERKSLEAKMKLKAKKVVNNVKTRKTKPLPQYNSVRDYDFLQYIRVVYKWALQNHQDLNRGQLEMLLYLYPKGAFSYTQFHKYHKLIGLYQTKALEEFQEKGYILIWQHPTRTKTRLFALTDKAKRLCDTMHKYCTGDLNIPTDRTNSLSTDKSKRNNGYYMDMIRDMNKRRKGKS